MENVIENRKTHIQERCEGHCLRRSQEMHIARMQPYADTSLNVAAELN